MQLKNKTAGGYPAVFSKRPEQATVWGDYSMPAARLSSFCQPSMAHLTLGGGHAD